MTSLMAHLARLLAGDTHAEAREALERTSAGVTEARARRARADFVADSLRRRVMEENHISAGIAALWRGEG